MRETITRGIERDDFSACGADFYARGHICAIAYAVGWTAGRWSRIMTPATAPRRPLPRPAYRNHPLRFRERRRPRRGVALLVALAALAGVTT
jgi:hypothetical protein